MNADDSRLTEFERVHLTSAFYQRHLLCGHPSWPESREPRPTELPHLATRINAYDTFVELTWSCAVCSATETAMLTNIEEWQELMASLTRELSSH